MVPRRSQKPVLLLALKTHLGCGFIPTISHYNTEHSLLMTAVRHGQKLQYQKTRDRSSLESIFQIQFQGEHSWNYTCFGF